MPKFQIITTDGTSYVDGDERHFEALGATERLESCAYDGDFVVLQYSGGVTDSIPESRIAHVIEA
ncbi:MULTISPECIES: hypothetical protein [Streptomyces]|uniref:Uncharacterized protein n=1 Tax=Streptomyces tricolor TaxID=68277 RepID=A0ABS9J822_9ACTN|nr:hypothetical protein [Streptomyces tricolor]MCG0061708.1 hypothetical protein [Streptomyces tricolor]MYU30678.1 hypothetical protein [Streptomyces sp. SID7810]CUW31753.1 hypothetical protein TUE45_06502 [Streptomyces reticuli]